MLKEYCVCVGKDFWGNNCFLNIGGNKLSGFTSHIVAKKKDAVLGPKETFSSSELHKIPTNYQPFIVPVTSIYPELKD